MLDGDVDVDDEDEEDESELLCRIIAHVFGRCSNRFFKIGFGMFKDVLDRMKGVGAGVETTSGCCSCLVGWNSCVNLYGSLN